MNISTVNRLLPSEISVQVNASEEDDWLEAVAALEEVKKQRNEVESKILGRCIRILDTRFSLKLDFNAAKRDFALEILFDTYTYKVISVPMKIKTLSIMNRLCKWNRSPNLKFSMKWRPIWNEAVELSTRARKTSSIASEMLTVNLTRELITFLHTARHYITKDDANEMLVECMASLTDMRSVKSAEAMICLISCLPTKNIDYDKMMPQWVKIWLSVEHNNDWHCCWLTLFARAKKHTKEFNWQSLMPLFLETCKELLQLPSIKGKIPQKSDFPHSFPKYYSGILMQNNDTNKTALQKITKLLYYTAYYGPIITADPITTTPHSACFTLETAEASNIPGLTTSGNVHANVVEIILFLQSVRLFFYPSNAGPWTALLISFLSSMVSEMSKHVARAMSRNIFPGASMTTPYASALDQPLHIPTMKYLGGTLLPFILESLYSKNQYMSLQASSTLKNLCTIDAEYGNVVIPFLLSALDPSAVNQSHQAPSAINTITFLFKSLLYPTPVILPYLPDILRLTLDGIDPNDIKKTAYTMNMITTIFHWIQIEPEDSSALAHWENGRSGQFTPTYLSIASITPSPSSTGQAHGQNSEVNSLPPAYTMTQYNTVMNSIYPALSSWCFLFVEKVFALYEAKEVRQSGGKAAAYHIGSISGETLYVWFHAIHDEELKLRLAEKIFDKLKSSTSSNAAKEFTRLLESLISSSPSLLPTAVQVLLTTGDLSSYSAEKLAFRLRLLGGALRKSTATLLLTQLPLVLPLLSKEYFHHADKVVRKCSYKLLKDVLKGLTSFYMTEPSYRLLPDTPVGHSNISSAIEQFSWNTPTPLAVVPAIALLKGTVNNAMTEIMGMLTATVGASSELPTLPYKKIEESIITELQIIRRAIRGAAEVLGDDCDRDVDEVATTAMITDDSCSGADTDTAAAGKSSTMILANTVAGLSPDDHGYLSQLRYEVLRFLETLHTILTIDSTPDNKTEEAGAAVVAIGTAYHSLTNCYKIRALWMKILVDVVTRRMAWLKDATMHKKYYGMNKRAMQSKLSVVLSKLAKKYPISDNSTMITWLDRLSSVSYWKGSELPLHVIADRTRIQYGLRMRELSFAATRRCVQGPQSRVYLACLNQLSSLCGHEYDNIRSKAKGYFQTVSSRFGWKMTSIIKPLIAALRTPGTAFSQAAGILSILTQGKVMKRILGQWSLTVMFLEAISQSPGMVNAIPENDKRQRLLDGLSGVFVTYLTHWYQAQDVGGKDERVVMEGLPVDAASNPSVYLNYLLSNRIITSSSSSSGSSGTGEESALDVTVPTKSGGLRYDLFAACTVLQFIGSNGIKVPLELWSWTVNTLCLPPGSPTQLLALSALTKLTYTAVIAPDRVLGDDAMKLEVTDLLQANLTPSLFLGVAQGHPKANENAQWSKGIDEILHTAEYFRAVLPRTICSAVSEKNTFSNSFRRDNAGLFMCLIQLATPGAAAGAESTVNTIKKMISAAQEIPATNEEEARINNATRAELFGGLCRALRPAGGDGAAGDAAAAAWSLLLSYFNEQTSKLSRDYCFDWAEGIIFGFSGAPLASNDVFSSYLSEQTRRIVKLQALDKGSGGEGGDEESFLKQSNSLLFTRSLLYADLAAAMHAGLPSSVLGESLLSLFVDPNVELVSAYRTSREEIAAIIVALVNIRLEVLSVSKDLTPVTEKLACQLEEALKEVGLEESDAGNEREAGAAVSLIAADQLEGLLMGQNLSIDEANASPTPPISPPPSLLLPLPLIASSITSTKSVFEMTSKWVDGLIHRTLLGRSNALLSALLAVTLQGSGHSVVEVAKLCQESCLLISQSVVSGGMRSQQRAATKEGQAAAVGEVSYDTLGNVLSTLITYSTHKSWYIRQTTLLCVTSLLTQHHDMLSQEERKRCKEVFNAGINDVRPEIQTLAKLGMVSYLVTKPLSELESLALAYTKNSDAFVAREKKRRKAIKEDSSTSASAANGASEKPDRVYNTTIMMMACLTMTFPYDLPSFMPALLSSFVKHLQVPAFKETVMKTIQDFKRTHQDRWDDFKLKFNHDQLADLQGAGAAHYFS